MEGGFPLQSLPMRGEWIEIYRGGERVLTALSLPMRGEWIEIIVFEPRFEPLRSLPMRGEWIEIYNIVIGAGGQSVSPHAGRVD